MDGLLSLLIVIIIASFVTSKPKKKPAGRQRTPVPAPPKSAAQKPAKPAPAPTMLPTTDAAAKRGPAAATVSPLQPSLAPTPHDHSDMFAGSMLADTGEGQDPHDHGFEAEPLMPSDTSEAEINASLLGEAGHSGNGGSGWFDFSPNSIARAFVMQEVLGRPGGIAESMDTTE